MAVEKLWDEHISKQKGYISFNLLVDGETWADSTTFETMDDANAFLESSKSGTNELAQTFYSFLNFNSCKSHLFSVEKSN